MRSGVRRRITSKPSMPGIWTSRKTTSGRSVSSAGEHFGAVAAFADDGEVREGGEELSDASACRRLVVARSGAPLTVAPRSDSRTISRYGTRSVAIVPVVPPTRPRDTSSDARSPYSARSRSRVFSMPWPWRHVGIAGSMPAPSSATDSSSVSPIAPARDTTPSPATRPASDRLAIPCRIAFSTRCCSAKLGTAADSDARRRCRTTGRRRSENRACSIARYCRTRSSSSCERDFIGVDDGVSVRRSTSLSCSTIRARRRVAVAHQHRDRVERVEQEVRIELRLERGEPRAGQLLRERASWISRSRASTKYRIACAMPTTARYTATPNGSVMKIQLTK